MGEGRERGTVGGHRPGPCAQTNVVLILEEPKAGSVRRMSVLPRPSNPSTLPSCRSGTGDHTVQRVTEGSGVGGGRSPGGRNGGRVLPVQGGAYPVDRTRTWSV